MFSVLFDTALYLSWSLGYGLSTSCLLVAVLYNFCNVFIVQSPEEEVNFDFFLVLLKTAKSNF